MKAEDLIALIEYGRQQGRDEAARRLRNIGASHGHAGRAEIWDAMHEAANQIAKPPEKTA